MTKYRTLFISDVHIGSNGCRIEDLLDFLKIHEFEYIYLVGDIIDGWELKNKWSWCKEYNTFFQKILKYSRKGIKIFYIVGNHDEFMEGFADHNLGDIQIVMETQHQTLTGESIYILHGHQFDGIVSQAKWIQRVGSYMYDGLININTIFNYFRKSLGFSYWSLSKAIKDKVKGAINYLNNYEALVSDFAAKKGYQSIMCGHIHTPAIKDINGVKYYNTGCLTEIATVIVEDYEGRLKIIDLDNEKHNDK